MTTNTKTHGLTSQLLKQPAYDEQHFLQYSCQRKPLNIFNSISSLTSFRTISRKNDRIHNQESYKCNEQREITSSHHKIKSNFLWTLFVSCWKQNNRETSTVFFHVFKRTDLWQKTFYSCIFASRFMILVVAIFMKNVSFKKDSLSKNVLLKF